MTHISETIQAPGGFTWPVVATMCPAADSRPADTPYAVHISGLLVDDQWKDVDIVVEARVHDGRPVVACYSGDCVHVATTFRQYLKNMHGGADTMRAQLMKDGELIGVPTNMPIYLAEHLYSGLSLLGIGATEQFGGGGV